MVCCCRMKFGKGFDWVRGGKLPGLCGADCITGCKDVTGLDGWSARQMWRPYASSARHAAQPPPSVDGIRIDFWGLPQVQLAP